PESRIKQNHGAARHLGTKGNHFGVRFAGNRRLPLGDQLRLELPQGGCIESCNQRASLFVHLRQLYTATTRRLLEPREQDGAVELARRLDLAVAEESLQIADVRAGEQMVNGERVPQV